MICKSAVLGCAKLKTKMQRNNDIYVIRIIHQRAYRKAWNLERQTSQLYFSSYYDNFRILCTNKNLYLIVNRPTLHLFYFPVNDVTRGKD